MAKWNNSDSPVGFLITFRTRGTWLHGDKRGSTSRHHNIYGTPKLQHDSKWLTTNTGRLKGDPVILTARQRSCVRKAILETCAIREWKLFALNIRTNHVHIVVWAPDKKPELVLNAFKANATRVMRERRQWDPDHSPWSDKGSNRYLWTLESRATAVNYVANHQGGDLPEFD
ncbi:MAG TPA: transposase [Pyrinomonadaceae bacterium]|nr:transposase [Pyrinomonadaceae bacterium]